MVILVWQKKIGWGEGKNHFRLTQKDYFYPLAIFFFKRKQNTTSGCLKTFSDLKWNTYFPECSFNVFYSYVFEKQSNILIKKCPFVLKVQMFHLENVETQKRSNIS